MPDILDRRQLLACATASAAGVLLGGCRSTTPEDRQPPDGRTAVVLGAGAAGLVAALDLHEAGWTVTVLEARDRIGGRVHTVTVDDGRFANLGAEWISTDDRTVTALCRRFGLKLVDATGYEGFVVDGVPVSQPPRGTGLFDRELTGLAERVTDIDRPWDDDYLRRLDERSLADWLRGVRGSAEATAYFTALTRADNMVELDRISLAGYVLLYAGSNSLDEALRIGTGSTTALLAAIGDALPRGTVRLGEPVIEVTSGRDRVAVRTTTATYDAAQVVVTAPLPVLTRITFRPSLDVPEIGYGVGGKLVVPYPTREWSSGPSGQRAETEMGFVYENSPDQPGPGGMLTAYSSSRLSTTGVTATFATWFPGLGRPDAAPISAWWHLDPWSGGTYSTPQPGYLDQLRRLREPLDDFGRVRLAGEHTELVPGYLESALVSGRRVAAAVAASNR
jgi:monoamine oxidase